MNVQGAAISLGGTNFVVVLVGMELVNAHGEADMTIESLSNGFSGSPVVLMAQKEDSTPVYYGDGELVRLLRDVPVDQMPWKEYPISI